MSAELLIAIVMLCQGRMFPVICQKEYVTCAQKETNGSLQAKAVADCIQKE